MSLWAGLDYYFSLPKGKGQWQDLNPDLSLKKSIHAVEKL